MGGSRTGCSLVDPAKVKVCRSYLFSELFLFLKIKSTWLILLSYLFFYPFGSMLNIDKNVSINLPFSI